MAANFDAPEIGKLAVRENTKIGDSAAAPGRYEDMVAAAENDTVGILVGGKALHDLSRHYIYDCKAIADVLSHVNELATRCDCDASRIARAPTVGRLRLG